MFADRHMGQRPELIWRELVQAGADDPQIVGQSRQAQVQQPGEQLALGQVTGGAEQDDGAGGTHGAIVCRGSHDAANPCHAENIVGTTRR